MCTTHSDVFVLLLGSIEPATSDGARAIWAASSTRPLPANDASPPTQADLSHVCQLHPNVIQHGVHHLRSAFNGFSQSVSSLL